MNFMIKTLNDTLRRLEAEKNIVIDTIRSKLKNREVVLNNKKYDNCPAKIVEYYYDNGNEYLRVSVNGCLDEFVHMEDCEFV
jgi:hypothetical protein